MITFKSKIIDLYDYKNIDLSSIAEPFSMNENELMAKIDRIRKKHAKSVDADCVQGDDFVTLSCKSDIEKFNKDNIVLRVGAGLFSKEFEEKILGFTINEEKVIAIDNTDVSVKIVKITRRVLDDLTDEVVKGYNIDGVTTVDELRAQIYNAEKKQYIDENAEGIASYISEQVAEKSTIELDDEDIANAKAEGYDFALSMIKASGLTENSSDDEFIEKTGRTKNDFIDFMVQITVDGIFGSLVGAMMMNEAGVELTDEQYENALAEYIEGMNCTEDEARIKYSYRKFELQQSANYYFKKIVEYVENYLSKE